MILNDYSEELTIAGTLLYVFIAIAYALYIFNEFMDSDTDTPEDKNNTKVMVMAPGTMFLIRVIWAIFKVACWPLVPLLEVGEILVQKVLARVRGYDAVAVTGDLESQKTETETEHLWSDDQEELDELSTTRVLYSSPYAPAA